MSRIKRVAFVLLLIALMSSLEAERRRSVTIGDITISIDKDKFQCDQFNCPLETTERCFISKKQDPKNRSNVLRTNACKSDDGDTISRKVTNEKGDLNSTVKVFIWAHRSGEIKVNSSIIFQDKKMEKRNMILNRIFKI